MAAYLDAAIASALKKAGKDKNFRLKSEQRAIIEAVVCSKKDVLGVLPTRFWKSLVFHLLHDVYHHCRIATKRTSERSDRQTTTGLPWSYYSRWSEKDQSFSNVLSNRGQTATDIFTPRTSSREQHKSDAENNQLSEKCMLHCSRWGAFSGRLVSAFLLLISLIYTDTTSVVN